MKKLVSILILIVSFTVHAQQAIQPASTTVAAFVDSYEQGPLNQPTLVTSMNEFIRNFGNDINVEQFFKHGGSVAYVVNTNDLSTGIESLSPIKGISTLVLPGLAELNESSARTIRLKAISLAKKMDAMVLFDTPPGLSMDEVVAWRNEADYLAGQSNVAIYYPRILVHDAVRNQNVYIGPTSAIAGIFATSGPWIAPAGVKKPLNIQGTEQDIDNGRNSSLSEVTINPIRSILNYGWVIWGSKTANGNGTTLRYISEQRNFSFIRLSLLKSLGWTRTSQNDPANRELVKKLVTDFLSELVKQGALFGFSVICDNNMNLKLQLQLLNPGPATQMNLELAKQSI